MKRIFKILLSIFLASAFALSGCTQAQGASSDIVIKERKEQKHTYSIEETEKYLVKDGKSEYVVVFPSENAEALTSTAVSELLYFFNEATGTTLKSVSDAGLSFDSSKKYISIGETSLLEGAGITYTQMEKDALCTSGFIIKTVGDSVFIIGDNYGIVNGVYGLLEAYFDFKVYAGDEIYLKTGITEQKFLKIEATDIPDIEHIINPYAGRGNTNYRLKLKTVGDVYAGNRGYVWHNILDGIIPFEIYGIDISQDKDVNGNDISVQMKDEVKKHLMYEQKPEWFNHPEWYVMEEYSTQDPLGNNSLIEPLQVNLTISEEGWTDEQNAESQKLLYEVLLYEMKLVLASTNTREMAFTAEDNQHWSKDAVSTANLEKYGTNAAEYIQCANYIAGELKKEYPDFRMTLFAYSGLKKAPTKLNGDGEYVPVDETVVLADNVDIMLCFQKQNRTTEFMDESENATAIELEKSWQPLIKKRTAWVYGLSYYQNFFMPTPTIMGLADNYRHFFENDYKLVFDEAQVGYFVSPDWAALKTYIVSSLGWNVYQDLNTLINGFFNQYYKVAAEPMLEAFHMEQNRLAQLRIETGDLSNIMSNSDSALAAMTDRNAWSDNLLQQILAKFDEAFVAIEIYKTTDPTLYQKLYNRILLETLSIRLLRAEIYGNDYFKKQEWMLSIYYDAKALGMTHYEGMKTLEKYFLN